MSPEDADLAARLAAAEAAIAGLPEPEPRTHDLHPTVAAWLRPLQHLPFRELQMLIIGRWRGRIIPNRSMIWQTVRHFRPG